MFAHWLLEFIGSYGYLAVFLGSVLEGETIIILAGLLAEQDHMSLPIIMVVAFVGSTFGDIGWFLLGKYGGTRVLTRFPIIGRLIKGPVGLVSRKPRTLSLIMRFIYGFRTILPFSLGMSPLKTGTFMLWNAVGALLWVVTFGSIGYAFGAVIESLFCRIHRIELILIIVIILGFALFHTVTSIAKRQLMKKTAGEDLEKEIVETI